MLKCENSIFDFRKSKEFYLDWVMTYIHPGAQKFRVFSGIPVQRKFAGDLEGIPYGGLEIDKIC
jgi:hypothetical protein